MAMIDVINRAIAPETVHRASLANGLRVLLRCDDSAPVVAIVTYVNSGYFDETDDIVGISHVLEHMFFKGTTKRDVGEISRETKAAGGYLNASTIYDHTSYYTVLPSSSFVRGLEIQADAFTDSLIDENELARELEVIIQEAKRKADSPSAVAVETLYEVLHDKHRMRRWRIGREPGLRALRREHVARFYRHHYRPGNTLLVVVGDVDVDFALHHIERLYGGLPAGEVNRARGPDEDAPVQGLRFRELEGDIGQTQLAIGWRTPGPMHHDTAPLDLAAAVLGTGRASRLYRAVRERSLASSVSAWNYTPRDIGVFTIHTEGPPEKAQEAARAAWHQVRDLSDAGVGSDELWRARRIIEGRWIRRLETMEGQANYLAEWETLAGWEFGERYLERLLTATPEQVTDSARRYLAPDECAIVVYRPRNASPIAADSHAMARVLTSSRPEPLEVPPPRHPLPLPRLAEAPTLERVEGRVRVYRTANGVPILFRHKAGAPLLHIGAYGIGGSCYEDESFAGLTLLLARCAIKGTERRSASQVAEDVELLGGSLSVNAGSESFGWSLSVPSQHGLAALELLADVVQHPTVPDDILETERAVATADLATLRDDMYRYPLRLLVRTAYEGHPYGVPVGGTEESLSSVSAERVRAWHFSRVVNGQVVIAIVGEVEADEAAAAAARCFAAIRPSEEGRISAPQWPESGRGASELRDKAQTAVALGFPSPSREDVRRYEAQLLASVASGLGGRFFQELRDRRSLAYTVQSFASERRATGMFVSYIATSPEKEDAAREGLLAEFRKLRDAPVSPEELSQAQAYALGTHAIRQQSGISVLADLVDAWLFGGVRGPAGDGGLAELDMYPSRVRAVTAEAMQRLARDHFDESRVVHATVRGTGRQV
ncbi:MAG: M16 family metallopeptidase [Gemmatimonadaceae bacterium]